MNGQRRVLHVATRILRAGSERNLIHTMDWERRAGFQVELATSSSPSTDLLEGFLVHEIEPLSREISPRRDLAALRQLRELVDRGRYDVVHTHQSKAGILGRLAARGRARHIVHTVHMASFGSGYNRAASAAFRIAERRTARATDRMIFVGTELRSAYLAAGIGDERSSSVIRSPIDVDVLTATRSWTPEQRGQARHTLGLPTDRPLVVWIGALSKRKRPVLAVQALAELLRSGAAALAIAGEGPERSEVESQARALGVSGSVHLLGHVVEVPSLLAASEVVVHTSTVEGVPQVLIQALAAARPVVATDVMGLREITPAAITVIDKSGSGLARAVSRRIAGTAEPVPLSRLQEWTTDAVDGQLRELHEALA